MRRAQENDRRERIFVEFIDQSSKAFADALLQTSMEDPSKVIPLYARMGKMRAFASKQTVDAAEKVIDLETRPSVEHKFDIVRDFAERCRLDLRGSYS